MSNKLFELTVIFFSGPLQIRGATNAVSVAKSKYVEEHGTTEGLAVVTHSSGNHAMALSLAATSLGVPAHIVMPKTSPRVKQESVRGYGGTVTLCEQPTEEVRVFFCSVWNLS